MTDIETIQAELRKFNRERDWDQFHNGKDLAIGLSVEAAELLECFLWKNPEDVHIDKIREELADVLNYAFQMADKYNLDIKEIMLACRRRCCHNKTSVPNRNSLPVYSAISLHCGKNDGLKVMPPTMPFHLAL